MGEGPKMNHKKAWLVTFVAVFFSCLSAQLGSGQDAERDPGQASVLLRGIVQDEQGNPIVGASIATVRFDGQVSTKTQSIEGGAFALRVPSDSSFGSSILVQDKSKRLASLISGTTYNLAERKNVFRVVLKPLRESTVTVVDLDGRPVPNASVRLYSDYGKFQESQTDAQGQVKLSFPADAKVDWILAFKAGLGFDYFENYDSFPTAIRLDVPANVQLKLDGHTAVQVKVVNTQNQPVAGVSVTPWSIQKSGRVSYINLSGEQLGKTDANGLATFDWIPNDLKGSVTFLIQDDRFHCPAPPTYVAGTSNKDLEAMVWSLCSVNGKVLHEDGTPAAGIRLQGEGRGATNHYYRGYTSTKSDGTFELKIYPDQETIIAITDERFAAKSALEIRLKEGEKIQNVDFKLSRGYLVSGKFTRGANKTPAGKQTATLIQQGPNGSALVRWSETDLSGNYRFRVGPGDYELILLDGQSRTITVTNEDLVFDSHVERLLRGPFTGKVTALDGKPLKADIYGESIGVAGHAGLVVKSNEDGDFATERWNDQMQLLAIDAVNRLALVTQITEDTESLTLVLAPAASVRGSASDANGKPIKNLSITASSREVPSIELTALSDANGDFAFLALPPKMTWRVTATTEANSISKDLDLAEPKEYSIEAFKFK